MMLLSSCYNNTIVFLLKPFDSIFLGKAVLKTNFTSLPSSMSYVKSCKLNLYLHNLYLYSYSIRYKTFILLLYSYNM